ncbi:hypothetical protein PSJ8397_01402 [Pseudooctadecabacter jejudonensis]|uniref:Uncharacterized protein n=2 Tax=Pseudooctadecabacter jejudonensis TaxID=1391910 RepID=A0A1Y5S5Y1_9RHOB|nr:hypothetical protein PSJ8397_01402 [Pseudooctadecabacter jejudonensis]
MKRRGFLQLLGGAIAAPLVPNVAVGAATKAAYPASALHAAIYHAQSRVNFSVFSLARQLGLDLDQAEALMGDMSSRGILGPLQGTTQPGRWARSKVWKRPFAGAAATGKVIKTARPSDLTRTAPQTGKSISFEVDLNSFLNYLRKMSQDQGLTLHPQCRQTT